MALANILLLIAILSFFAYWQLRERGLPIDRRRTGYSPRGQIIARSLSPVIGLLLILQLLNIIEWRITLSATQVRLWQAAGIVLFGVGVLLAIWAREVMGKNWTHAADYQVKLGQQLITDGPFRYIRHPIYAGNLLMVLGLEIYLGSWLIGLAVPLFVYFLWQARREERLLIKAFGAQYEQYQRQAGLLWPHLK